MLFSESSTPLSTENIERKFLCLDKNENNAGGSSIPPVEDFLSSLMILHECKALESRDQCSMVLQQHLVDQCDFSSLVKLLKVRAEWLGDMPIYGEECRDILLSSTKDRMLLAKAESVLFGKEKPVTCLKRLELLVALVPGAICCDKTWGYGVVKKLDDFYKRIVVDFDRKPDHAMAFSYAGQALKIIDDKHILTFRHANPAAFDEKCRKKAGEVVAMALNSYGQMSVLHLESEMTNGILPAGVEWKSFWTQARAQLKNDQRFKLPPTAKKNDLIEFAENAKVAGDSDWFADLAALNDVPEIINRIFEFMLLKDRPEIDDTIREILKTRLSFSLKGCATTHNDKDKVRTIMAAVSLGFKELPVELRSRQSDEFAMVDENNVDLLGTLTKPEIILNAASKMPAGLMSELVSLIPLKDNAEVARGFVDILHVLPFNLIESMALSILEGVASASFADQVRKEFSGIDVSFALLLWLCRNQDKEIVTSILPAAVIGTQALLALEPEVMGENLRLQHLIAALFRDEIWLECQTQRMTDVERGAFFARVRAADGAWEPLKKRAIEKCLLKLYPELAASGATESSAPAQPTQRITSWKSLSERKEKHRMLVEQEMPKNNQDIEAARILGDLRENFEYQTAKEQQRILISRQAELELELREMRGTDFSEVEFADKVVVGSEVTLLHADGHTSTFQILGEWDSDLALGIIPSRSRMAEALLGHVAGDKVMIPSDEEEEVDVTISSIQPLPRTILDWASGR